MSLTIYIKDQKLPLKVVKHVCPTGKIESLTQLLEILNLLERKYCELVNGPSSNKRCLEFCADFLEKALPNLSAENEIEISFIIEQIRLCVIDNSRDRRYSQALLGMTSMWNSTSSTLYKQILNEGVITLPSTRTLYRLSSAITVDTGFNDSALKYIKLRTENLNQFERKMSILIDEVYASNACEFVNGQFRGIELHTDNPHKTLTKTLTKPSQNPRKTLTKPSQNPHKTLTKTLTKTLLSIMISGVTSNYSEIVEMIPVVKLDSALLKTMFFQIVQQLTPMYIDPVCCIVGGHSSNRKFYQHELCEGSLREYIVNLVDSSKVIHLSFDPTHFIKCILTILLTENFSRADFNDKKVEANFEHVVRFYKSEIGKPIKYAYKLANKVMTPNGIEKTSVKLADALFHRSTIEGLKVYGEKECPDFLLTVSFLEIIRDWWDSFNVKASDVGFK